jgi:hypothetical protein
MRQIIEEHRFSDELRKIIEQSRRADEFIVGAKWTLSRNPQAGKRIGASEVWFLAMEETPGILPIVLCTTHSTIIS